MAPSFFKAAALAIAVTVSAGIPAYAATELGGPDEKTRYEYAESLYRQGAYDTAVAEFTSFIKDYPKGPYTDDACYWLGMRYMDTGREADGLEQFKIILALMPDGDRAPSAQFELAYYWYNPATKERDLERAMAEFLKIPFFYPESALADDAVYYAALSQYARGRYSEAAAELDDFMEKFPASEFAPPAGYYKGLAHLLDGRAVEALASFQSVRDTYPAGLYAQKALHAAGLVGRARDVAPLKELYRFGGKGDAPGKLYKPEGVAIGPEGVLYVADMGNSRVQSFSLTDGGMELTSSSISPPTLEKKLKMDEPFAVALGPKGRVYVADRGEDRVQVFDPEGGLLFTFGNKGSGPGELNEPAGIAVDEGGYIYVAERVNKRVSVFDASGRYLRSVGTGGDPDKALRSPSAVAVDIEGRLLVADDSDDALYGYDRTGTLVTLYEKDPSGGFELGEPSGIAVDIAGNVYVSDSGRGVVIMFDRELAPLMELDPEGRLDKPSGVSVSEDGLVFVTDYGSDQVVVLK